ncbi:short-chain dehydrogenase/reductase sdr [Basidiobolus meristosporus CBS 931.73]|uniref:Short-chain dehydrogenase/reductase sdr n=1 Tax=Basidiobolus meristosporus CBS 931.73 TaxID=1314790 RepID=A0A1Y1YH55_9FUNG|nr:short-chain dehydrogenase/reductase sdr [Basidiobolus meristosporus CBS 931.73]|eukprot:ORX97325.1 short-chain dehydrogenase/reductase sdr [Basidiobolus meristosporus CBS 931.73]
MSKSLAGVVALVTGASRGAGKGIALCLGEAGCTVYVTGRSSSTGTTTQGRAETVEQTAERVTALGGKGIAVICDHGDDGQVKAVFDKIAADYGKLDLLVNNAWGGYETEVKTSPFWELHIEHWDTMSRVGVRSNIVAASLAAALMVPRKKGLIINISSPMKEKYNGNLYYDVVKSSLTRISFGMNSDLSKHNITALALSPGWMMTERMVDANVPEEEHKDIETVNYVGRAVVALASNESNADLGGKMWEVGEIARMFNFTDVDGRQLAPFSERFPERI